MSQHDMDVANGAGLTVRTDMNAALQALASLSSGAGAPNPTFPCQPWADTGTGRQKRRNSANTLWLDVGPLDLSLPTQLVTQDATAFTSAGTAPSFTITPSTAITAYAANQRFRVKFHAAGSGANTLSVSGLSAKSLKQYDVTGAKVAAVITAGLLSDVEYDGTDMVLLNPLPGASNDTWIYQPIGVPIPVFDHMAGVSVPSTSSPYYRYIKLTAADSFNTGVLVSESVTGSVPLVLATAVISLSGSPVNGLTVSLINTERRALRAGSAGTLENDQMQGHVHSRGIGPTANIDVQNSATPNRYSTSPSDTGAAASDGTNGTPRVGLETRGKNIGATYYMRIK